MGALPSRTLDFAFWGAFLPRIASRSPSSGSISSRSNSLTSGTLAEPGGITRALTTNWTREPVVMKRSPMTLKKTFSTLRKGSWRATATASLYCPGDRTPG